MNEPTPDPLLEHLPPVKDEPLGRRVLRYLRPRWGRFTAIAAVVAGVIAISGHFLGGVAGYWEFYRVAGTGHAKPRAGLADRPFRSIAVLPVTSDSPSEQAQSARKLTQELTAAATRAIPDGLVVSSGMAGQYASSPRDPRKIGQELNVRYLLEPALSGSGDAQQLALELVDSLDGKQVWSARYPLEGADGAAAMGRAGNELRNAILAAGRKEVAAMPEDQRLKWELAQKAWDLSRSIDDTRRRHELMEEVLRLDADFVPGLIGLSHILWLRTQSEPDKRDELVARMDSVTLRATRVAPNDPRAWVYRGIALRYQGNWNGAFAASQEALRIDPFRSQSLTQRAALLMYAGRPAESVPLLDRALELDPIDTSEAALFLCYAYLQLARDADALPTCEVAAARTPAWTRFMFLAAAHANLGNKDKAAHWKRKLVEANPKISLQRLRDIRVSDNAEFIAQREHWLAGLRKAGVPEK